MDFKDQIKQLGDRALKLKEQIQTEEATKNAFIMPFLQVLGYDVFNPTEVVPEMTCDVANKKGERIDYAIIKEGAPIILIECKHHAEDLDLHKNQLLRYFGVSSAKFGILTNGVIYRFYSDLEKPNIMDNAPFLEFDITNVKDTQVEELRKFHKSSYNEKVITDTAEDLKYINKMRSLIASTIINPDESVVKVFARHIFDGQMTANKTEYFNLIFKRAFNGLINDTINDRLKAALKTQEEQQAQEEGPISEPVDKVATTEVEIQGFYIVKSILYGKIADIESVVHRDTQSYFGILYGDNNRQPICRLHLNGSNKYIETFDADKKGTRHPITSLNDIYLFANVIIETANRYK